MNAQDTIYIYFNTFIYNISEDQNFVFVLYRTILHRNFSPYRCGILQATDFVILRRLLQKHQLYIGIYVFL